MEEINKEKGKIKIRVPYFKQKRRNTCGLACLTMLLNYQGYDVQEEELYKYVASIENGTSIPELVLCALRYVEENDINDLVVEAYLSDIGIPNPLVRDFHHEYGERLKGKTSMKEYIDVLENFFWNKAKALGFSKNIKPRRAPNAKVFEEDDYHKKKEVLEDLLYEIRTLRECASSPNCSIIYKEKVLTDENVKRFLDQKLPFFTTYWLHGIVVVGYSDDEKIFVHDPAGSAYEEWYPLWAKEVNRPVILIRNK